jgi:hypothetical protein
MNCPSHNKSDGCVLFTCNNGGIIGHIHTTISRKASFIGHVKEELEML